MPSPPSSSCAASPAASAPHLQLLADHPPPPRPHPLLPDLPAVHCAASSAATTPHLQLLADRRPAPGPHPLPPDLLPGLRTVHLHLQGILLRHLLLCELIGPTHQHPSTPTSLAFPSSRKCSQTCPRTPPVSGGVLQNVSLLFTLPSSNYFSKSELPAVCCAYCLTINSGCQGSA